MASAATPQQHSRATANPAGRAGCRSRGARGGACRGGGGEASGVLEGAALSRLRREIWHAEYEALSYASGAALPRRELWHQILARRPYLAHVLARRLDWDGGLAAAELEALSLRLNPDPTGRARYPSPPRRLRLSRPTEALIGCLRESRVLGG